MRITRKGIFVKDSDKWFEDFKSTLYYQVLEFLIYTTEKMKLILLMVLEF